MTEEPVSDERAALVAEVEAARARYIERRDRMAANGLQTRWWISPDPHRDAMHDALRRLVAFDKAQRGPS